MLTEKQILNFSKKCKKLNLENIHMDNLDNNNTEELQFKHNNTHSLTKQYLESFVKEIAEGRVFIANMFLQYLYCSYCINYIYEIFSKLLLKYILD
jgi:hypothetical protein